MTSIHEDRQLRAAFGPARLLEPTDAEVTRVVARARARRPRRRRLVAVAAVAGVLVLAGGAATAGGLFDEVGTVTPESRQPQLDGLSYTSDRTVVATGRTPVAGSWRMTAAESDQGFCLGLELPDVAPQSMGEGCGGRSGTLDVGSTGGGDDLPDVLLVHGATPEQASAVRISAPGGFSQTAATHEGPATVAGDFFLVEIPRKGTRGAEITWLDQDGRAQAPAVEVPMSGP